MHTLYLMRAHRQQLLAHARQAAPQEACGLLAGQQGRVQQVLPVPNVADDPRRQFVMQPEALLRALKRIDAEGQVLLAVYHSHPAGDAVPSPQDLRDLGRAYPHVLHLVIGLRGTQPTLQAWHLAHGMAQRAGLQVGKPKQVTDAQDAPLSRAQVVAVLLAAALAFALMLALSIALLPPAPPIPTPGA